MKLLGDIEGEFMYQNKDLYVIDFRNVNYYLEMHNVIKEALDFPEYYGCNWSALWDCLTEMVGDPMNIEILGLDVIERRFGAETSGKLLEILKRTKHYSDDKYAEIIHIYLVGENQRIEIK